jgi:hypothetical protein
MVAPAPSVVALAWGAARYNAPPPFSPGTAWSEHQRILLLNWLVTAEAARSSDLVSQPWRGTV